MITARFKEYVYNLLRGVDELGDAALAGNSRQTLSSRAYEAVVVKGIWYWRPIMRTIDFVAYLLTGVRNHCMDAWQSDQKDRTY